MPDYITYDGTITGAKTKYVQRGSSSYSGWYTGSSITSTYSIGYQSPNRHSVYYRVTVNPQGRKIANVIVNGYANLPITQRSLSQVEVTVSGSTPQDTAEISISGNEDWNRSSSFAGNVQYIVPISRADIFSTDKTIYIEVADISPEGVNATQLSSFRITSVQIQTTPPDLSLLFSPISVIAGDSIAANITGRYGRALNLTLVSYGVNLTPTPISITSDSTIFATQFSWYDDTSYTGNSLRVNATVTDPVDGRSDSDYFKVNRPVALSVTADAPKSFQCEGGEDITFAWSVSGGNGTQSSAELQCSYDNANWSTFGTVNGNETLFTKTAPFFRAGTVYWRVSVRSTYGVTSVSNTVNFTVRYSATSYIAPLNSPTGGNVNANAPITFAGTLISDGVPYEPFTVASATFYWRSRVTDPYTQVSMTPSGANASVTIDGGTFPTGSVSWYIEATDNAGTTTQTSVYTISTLASAIDAQPVSPVNTVEISNNDIEFVWRFASTSGDPQNGAEVQYSLDGESWTQLDTVEGTVTTIVIPPDTFHSGTVYWKVRAFNSVGDAGQWSSIAQFVAYGAPEAPSVTVDAVPFATILWQGSGQVSYEVEVDGTDYGPFLGDEKAYSLFDYLEDGSHKARVRILGEAGLWSLWGETLFNVVNVPQTTLSLSARTDVDTELSWVGGSNNYYVYRDRKLIGRTNGKIFSDRTALGVHEYRVVERLANGNYNASNDVTRTMEVQYMHIAALEGGDWIKILHTLKGSSDPSYDYSALAEFNHIDSREFPVVSAGPYLDENAKYSAVFLYTEADEHRRFRALFRKPVILKTSDDVVMIGFLNAWENSPKTSRDTKYYIAYTFTLQRIDWEDFIDDTT